ncbi:c-type cytochrome [Rhodoferax sp.]|uniref:c-type cytochrome n=1 Tax=Rhodoferax sp. TaxID=50421 RepID=UPI0025E38B8D|nr:c-type cytochrome [Rhodoferax sp.]
MKHKMSLWGTSGLMLLALAGCDGGSGQPAAQAVAVNEPAATAPAPVVSEATAPASPVTVDTTAVQAPPPAVVTKVAPPPVAVIAAPPPPPPPPAVVVAAAPPPSAAVADTAAPARAAADPDGAKVLFKANDCSKCHAVDKAKKGSSLKKIAAKYKGKADGQAEVIKSMTSGHKVKFDDGTEEDHKIVDTTDQKELKNLADWILSQ